MAESPITKVKTSERIAADGILLLAAVIWGGGFVAQRSASFELSFYAFNGIRFLVGGLVMLPFIIKRLKNSPGNLHYVLPAGVLLFSASSLQQIGVGLTAAGTAGFITGTYVVLVPILLSLFWKFKIKPVMWIAVLAALAGTYLLSTGGSMLAPSSGNTLLLAGSVLWAFHVIVVGLAVKKLDVFVFSVGQFLVCGTLNLALALLIDPPTMASIQNAWLSVLYASLASVVLGFTLQAVGQRKAPAADAALILSLESVFAAIFGALLLHERLNGLQILGCAIILATIIFTQLPFLQPERDKIPIEPRSPEIS